MLPFAPVTSGQRPPCPPDEVESANLTLFSEFSYKPAHSPYS